MELPRGTAPWLRGSGGRLSFLGQVDALALQHVQQRLGRLHDLGVGSLCLLDRLVVLVAGRDLACEVVVDSRQPLRQDAQVILDLGLLLLILSDGPIQVFALLTQLLDA